MLLKFICFVFIVAFLDNCNAAGVPYKELYNWEYVGEKGPSHWSQLGYGECNGTDQSPINLIDNEAIFKPNTILLTNYNVTPQALSIENIGDTVRISIQTMKRPTITLIDSNRNYVFDNAHFHWGESCAIGSEHHVNGHGFPMEAHLVHYNSAYANLSAAATQPHGLMVIAVFLQCTDANNNNLHELLNDVRFVPYANDTHNDTAPFPLQHLLPDLEYGATYYTYNGSLTTPACHQTVQWLVLHEPIAMGRHQMESFRLLQTRPREYDPERNFPLTNNHRPTQPLNSRQLYRSRLPYSAVHGYHRYPNHRRRHGNHQH